MYLMFVNSTYCGQRPWPFKITHVIQCLIVKCFKDWICLSTFSNIGIVSSFYVRWEGGHAMKIIRKLFHSGHCKLLVPVEIFIKFGYCRRESFLPKSSHMHTWLIVFLPFNISINFHLKCAMSPFVIFPQPLKSKIMIQDDMSCATQNITWCR